MQEINSAIVVYGTHSGNAEIVAESICSGIAEVINSAKAIRAELTSTEEVIEHDLIVFVSSTYNVGKLNDHFVPFAKEFSKLAPEKTSEKLFAVVGLGFSEHYDIYAGAADELTKLVKKVGGQLVADPLKIDGPPHGHEQEYAEFGKSLVILNYGS